MKTRFLLLAALSTAASVSSCKKKEDAPPQIPPTVLVQKVRSQTVPLYDDIVATLDGSTNTDIRAQVQGYLIKRDYTQGAYVRKGERLFQIDPRQYQASLEKAQADLSSAQADQLKTKQDLDRNKQLLKSYAISQKSYEQSVQANESAIAQVQSAQAAVTEAELQLSYTDITAPIDGIAGTAQANLGDLVSSSDKLTVVSTLDPIRAAFNVSENFYLRYAKFINEEAKRPMGERHKVFELILPDGSVYPEKGVFDYINREVATGTGTIMAYALFSNPDNLLRPGLYVRVRVRVRELKDAIVIPQRAVTEIQSLYTVAVVNSANKAAVRNIKVGPRVGSNWIIESGLEAGDTLIVEGSQKVKNGTPVVPKPWKPPPGTSSRPSDTPMDGQE